MPSAGCRLAAIAGLALLVLGLATPASADPGRYQWRHHWDDHSQDHQRDRDRAKVLSGSRNYRYFGTDPDRYFGPGPGSYECYGYDCIW